MFIVGLVAVMGVYLLSEKQGQKSSVPLPRGDDAVRTFFNLIDEDRVSEAVMMMDPEVIKDDAKKQEWGVMWNSFEEIKMISVEPAEENVFKVVLETKMKPEAGLAQSLPYYGYGDGQFTRWVKVEKVDGVWKIIEVATGP